MGNFSNNKEAAGVSASDWGFNRGSTSKQKKKKKKKIKIKPLRCKEQRLVVTEVPVARYILSLPNNVSLYQLRGNQRSEWTGVEMSLCNITSAFQVQDLFMQILRFNSPNKTTNLWLLTSCGYKHVYIRFHAW